MRLIYIHGFGSCGKGNKYNILKNLYIPILAPDLPPSPKDAINTLDAVIKPDDIVIGSSLGGYYAIYLAERYFLKAILINPSLKPYKTLKQYTGLQFRFCDKKPFYWQKEYLKELKNFKTKPKRAKYLVLLQSKDEILNYKKTLKKFKNKPNAKVIVEYGGNHRFENLYDYLSLINNFIK
ncbi:conserved hypothetical protein [Lebetimonas natsushimae]|uniref:Esterase n=1 Tax=Lebetimonas natsushimae TaxID=1936991 RepID=A0A292YEG2_9BACT|nr:YqiA/YcfP family alpha/beta fold hydrolase [Lebetimonas natsushimae]GAX87948.1 conserved hypothetical protein [Lebetimonas natsushimae]